MGLFMGGGVRGARGAGAGGAARAGAGGRARARRAGAPGQPPARPAACQSCFEGLVSSKPSITVT